ncbi:porin [Gemmata sp. JC717]|uniref:OprO/OprP family phosphate-selective porin n=1 Tax=Gemmata algarum TaxID=2975278 RepID=UPI0021BB9419|nr:porin [Gemmata algarum]MDY3554297.1 porin [Gemmata algarum]
MLRPLFALALCAACLICARLSAQERPAVTNAPVQPVEATSPAELVPAADGPKDKLTELMQRVSNLEDELKKSKQKAADAAKKPTLNWSVQIQADSIWSDQDAVNRAAVGSIPDGAAFRRARFNMFGEYGQVEYRLGLDFALPGRPSFIDVFVGLNDVPWLGHVRAGHFFEPFGLEQYSQNRFITFMERSLPTEPISPGRNTGVMAFDTYADQRGTWAVGAFHTDSDVFGDDTGNDFRAAATGRVTYLPWYDEATDGRDLLHLGLAYSARATKGGQVRFAVRPELRSGSAAPNVPNFVDTGAVGAGFYQLIGAEALLIRGPFSAQGEYVLVPIDTYASGAVYLQSWYVYGSVFLTGENRTYRRSTGMLDRILPRRDFVGREARSLGRGPGAWELALRLSHLDLNNGSVRGGRLTDLTAGLNWYLNPYLRITANYIRAFQTTRTGRHGAADLYGVRVGFDF